jgi:hypothetical protein
MIGHVKNDPIKTFSFKFTQNYVRLPRKMDTGLFICSDHIVDAPGKLAL